MLPWRVDTLRRGRVLQATLSLGGGEATLEGGAATLEGGQATV
jgi:hypothetical protein